MKNLIEKTKKKSKKVKESNLIFSMKLFGTLKKALITTSTLRTTMKIKRKKYTAPINYISIIMKTKKKTALVTITIEKIRNQILTTKNPVKKPLNLQLLKDLKKK